MTTISLAEAIDRIEGVLKAAGIKADIFSHHDGVDIDLLFPDGALCTQDDRSLCINVDGYIAR